MEDWERKLRHELNEMLKEDGQYVVRKPGEPAVTTDKVGFIEMHVDYMREIREMEQEEEPEYKIGPHLDDLND